jgi:hypothetical protein
MTATHKSITADRLVHVKPEGFTLNKDDVWGAYDMDTHTAISAGLIVAKSGEKCPIFKDTVPYKSVTVAFDPKKFDESEVEYWLGYVHGGDNISRAMPLEDGRIAIRSDYTCW